MPRKTPRPPKTNGTTKAPETPDSPDLSIPAQVRRSPELRAIRKATERLMTCRHCGGPMGIGQMGFVCLDACPRGKIITASSFELDRSRRAWPDRIIERRGRLSHELTAAQHRRAKQGDPCLPLSTAVPVATPPQ